MSDETDSNQENNMNEQVDTEAKRLREAIARIKQPPAIDQVLSEQSPQELVNNPTVAPERFDEAGDLRDDLRRED